MTCYTGKNGTAGVGDMNPGADVYIESVGEFGYGSHIVEISEVGLVKGGKLETIGFPTRFKGNRLDGTAEQRKLMEKARRLARATLTGSVRAEYLGIFKVEDGEQHVRFLVSRNLSY